MTDAFPDLQALRFEPPDASPVVEEFQRAADRPKKAVIKGGFLKGPIPLNWLSRAACLPGKALAVALAIWFEIGRRRRSNDIKLTTDILRRFDVGRKAKYRALKELEDAELITVVRAPRKNPLVTILELVEPPTPAVGL